MDTIQVREAHDKWNQESAQLRETVEDCTKFIKKIKKYLKKHFPNELTITITTETGEFPSTIQSWEDSYDIGPTDDTRTRDGSSDGRVERLGNVYSIRNQEVCSGHREERRQDVGTSRVDNRPQSNTQRTRAFSDPYRQSGRRGSIPFNKSF